MKLWNNYKKEMKIASRGFYFYMEIVVAVIILAVLLMVVPTEQKHKMKEVLFCDVDEEEFEALMDIKEGKGYREKVETEEFKLRPAVIKYTDDKGKKIVKEYKDKKKVKVKQYYYYDAVMGKHTKTEYYTDNFDDMIRISYSKKMPSTEMWIGEDNQMHYHTVLFGYETEKYKNLIKMAPVDHVMLSEQLQKEADHTEYLEEIEVLNYRENFIPVLLILLNGMLGIMVIIAYISVDKSEGVIKALCVSPLRIGSYLISKTLVALTTMLLSSAIITIPVMRGGPNYFLFFIAVVSLGILSSGIGILISTFFQDVQSSFGTILVVGVFLLIPIVSYLIPSFHPKWIEYIPSYYMLEGLKESLLTHGDAGYVLTVCAAAIAVSIVLYLISEKRYKKILGM